ncbi:glycoside hydrolase [Dyadobacter sp. CY261]|uniref:glycosyl hydrolase-related protein n=1 Tax=Dyadobacter sp. CY261 TaxID=2907203 RepID=UPI001F1C0C9D|nr:glycosyl hydrolase-related protein [Dyadobacter sp. CY261]MCF0069737.1 glycoside hydrolase [Dyadobacter sp. CY261]
MKYFRLQFLFLLASVAVQGQPVKRLYLANDDHTDYMWTADEATYDSAFVHMLDYHLDQIDSTRNNPPDFQARFNCDGSYWIRAYQKYRSAAQFGRLIAAIRSGHIGSPLNTLVSTYGAQPTEAVIRGMYYAGQLERAFKLRFTLAEAMENNTIPLGLSSLWAGSGAKYSWKGIGGYGSQMTYESRENRRHQLYHFTGPDSSSVLMKWYNFTENNKRISFGGYAECRLAIKSDDKLGDLKRLIGHLDALCDTISPTSRYPYNVAGAFGYGHDDLDNFTSKPFLDAARSETTANRKVRLSNEIDFFEDISKTYPNIPSESVSYGNEWDLYCASMNETTARVRRSVEKLRAAEALSSLVALNKPALFADLEPAKNLAWQSLGMYWEHNWTADGPVRQPVRADWQIKVQQQLSSYTDSLYNRSVSNLGHQIKKGRNQRFYVFNPLNWTRDDIADFEYAGSEKVIVNDLALRKEVISQLVWRGNKKYLRIKAEGIPSVGYKVYEIRPGTPKPAPDAVKVSGEYISNSRYRLRLSRSGAITELYDSLAGGRQLVRKTDNRYLNDLGSSDKRQGNPLMIENAGPVSVTVKAVSNDPVPHTVRLTLFKDSPRIDIQDSIQVNFKDVKTWAFSFDLNNQTTRHEELGAVLTAKLETRQGHYASQNARLDWQTFNHFADMSEKDYGVTLSNVDCSFFKLGKSTVDSLHETSSQLSALAGGRVDTKREDKGVLGIANQHGERGFLYQFALSTHQEGFDALQAMRFALEHQNPLVTGLVTGATSLYPETVYSLLRTDDPGLLLWSIKPSEEGIQSGLVTRFWNINPIAAESTIAFDKQIRSAWQTSHIETDQQKLDPKNGSLPTRFRPHQIQTFRVTF